MLCMEKWVGAQLKLQTSYNHMEIMGEMCLLLPGWNVVSMLSFPKRDNLRGIKSRIPKGTWWYFLADTPCSIWQPREIKEDDLLNQQLWQNHFPGTDVYPYPKVISDIILILLTTKVWLLLTEYDVWLESLTKCKKKHYKSKLRMVRI